MRSRNASTPATPSTTTDYLVNLKNEVNIETLMRELGELRAEVAQYIEARARH